MMMTEKEIEQFLGELDSAPTKEEGAIKKVRFPSLDSLVQERTIKTSLSHIEDVNVTISAELGQRLLKFREVLSLDVGAVVELEKSAGDAISVYVNDKKMAQGEIIIVNDKFAMRINSIIPPKNTRRENE